MEGKVTVLDHPLLKHKLGYLRDRRTNSVEFRNLTKEISVFLAYEATRQWKDMIEIDIETPIAKAIHGGFDFSKPYEPGTSEAAVAVPADALPPRRGTLRPVAALLGGFSTPRK